MITVNKPNGKLNNLYGLAGYIIPTSLPLLVFLLLLATTSLYWNYVQQQTQAALKDYFDFRVRQAVMLTEQRILAQEQVLRGARGLFDASKQVSREDFRRYVASLHLEENYRGIQGVGFTQIVRPEDKNAHIALVRKDSGRTEYTIKPEGERDFYTSIIYLEPFYGRNLRAFGYDMYSEPVRRAALDKARDSGTASMTGKVKLLQEDDKNVQAGFLIYLPVYQSGAPQGTVQERRNSIIGWVYSPLRMTDLAQGTYGDRADDLDIEIYDGDRISPERLMYDSSSSHSRHAQDLVSVEKLKLVDHEWSLVLRSTSLLQSRFKDDKSTLVAYSGIALSILIAVLVWLLIHGRTRAEKYAKQMTLELSQENEKNLALLRNASDGIHILDTHGNIVEASNSFCEMLGYERDELVGMNVREWDAGFQEPELTRVFKEQFKTTERSQFETRHRRKDGSIFDVEVSGIPIALGGKTLLFNSSRDISERKRIHDDLVKNEYEFRLLAEAVPQIVWITRADGWNIFFNQQWVDYTGLTLEESYGHGWNKPFHPGDQQRAWDAWQKAVKEDAVYSLECRLRRADGEYRWWLIRGEPAYNSEGKIYKWFGTCTDIDDIKLAEEKLKTSEQRYRTLIEDQTELICRFKADGTILFVNEAFCRFFGQKHDDIVGTTWCPMVLPEDLPLVHDRLTTLSPENPVVTIENRVIVADGSMRWGQFINHGFYNDDGVLVELQAVARDITERKLLEKKLEEAKREIEDLYDHAPCSYHSIGPDHKFLHINATELEWLGCTREEVIGKKSPADFFTPESSELFKKTFPKFLRDGHIENIAFDLVGKNGEIRPVSLSAIAITDEQGNFVRSRSVMFDVTELRKIENALRTSEERFRTMANSAPVLIWIAGLDKTCYWFNKVWLEFTGRTLEQEIGNGWAEGVHPDDFDQCLDIYMSHFDRREEFRMEYRLRRHDGEYRWIDDHGVPLLDSTGNFSGYIGSCIDITESKQTSINLQNALTKFESQTERLQTILENASDAIHILDSRGNIVQFSESFAHMLGYTHEETAQLNVADWDAQFPREQLQNVLDNLINTTSTFETKHRRKDGSMIDVEIHATEIVLDGVHYLYASGRDISERKQQEMKLRQLSQEQQVMLDNELVGIIKVKDRKILWRNKAMDRIFGYESDELLGASTRILYPDPLSYKQLGEVAYPILRGNGVYRTQLEMVRNDGQKIWIDLSGVLLSNQNAESMWMMMDITSIKQHEEDAIEIAYHDILTGLPNRLLVSDRLQQAMAQAERSKRMVAVCYLDLDGFKPVNDTYGHEAGDYLLKVIAKRMQDAVRTNDTVGRFGGDEFVLLLTNLESIEEYQVIVERLAQAINQPITLNNSAQVTVGASIGISIFPADGHDSDKLLRQADQAMYQAKQAGRNQICLFENNAVPFADK